ncbi:MAG: radical SAM/SPASM domain-containing protein, partial [Candidatus Micrarchaeota archaeon]
LNKPVSLLIESTAHCNLRCITCPRVDMTRPLGSMKFAFFKKIIDEAPFVYSVGLHYMGEPLLNPEIFDFIGYAKSKGINNIYLSTNVTLLTPEKSAALLDTRIDNVILSLDGATKRTYERVRRNANYESSVRNVKAFLELREKMRFKTGRKPHVFLQVIKTNETVKEIDDFRKQWSGYDVEITCKNFCTWANQLKNAERVSKRANWYHPAGMPWHCANLWESMVVTWDGIVVPCCYDFNSTCVLGDLKKQSVLDVWNGEPMQALRASQTGRKPVKLCAGCTDKPGHSPLAFYRDFGTSKYARAVWNFKRGVERRIFG